jgi:hypothetical protein
VQIKKSYIFLYGLAISGISCILLLIFTPLSIFSIFTANTTNSMINVGRFFLLSGIALFLLNIPSILKTLGLIQEKPQTTSPKGNLTYKILFGLQLALGLISFYMFFAVSLSIGVHPETNTLANIIFIYALLATSLVSFGATLLKTWIK